MVKFLLNRPVAVLMASIAFLLLGIVASLRIPTSLMPDIAIPEITVQLSYPNNTSRELETNVVRPLRNQLLQVTNLKDIESETRDGFAYLKLVFDYGTNTDYAFIETNEKVDAALNFLPRDLERPKVIKASTTDVPIVNLTVSLRKEYSTERFLQLSEFAETVLKKRIEQLPDIAFADLSGQTQSEVRISPHADNVRSLGISNNALIEAIKQNNFELGNLIVQNGIYQYNFSFSNPLKTKKDIEDIYLNIEGRLLQIKDVAQVELSSQQERGSVFHNGKRSVVLAIIKQADARVYELKEELDFLLAALEKDYPDLEFHTNQDQTQLLQLSIDNLKSSLWLGGSLAILIMFFFLNDIKAPIIIAISIPVSLVLSLLFLYLFGLSINIISLSGLILGIGMMIDNSIIVIDNITQKLESGLSLFEACAKGTNEIITPLITSVLTTCSVFLPLVFLSGITGALFYDQAIAISIGLGASLLVSIIIIPVLFRQLQRRTFPLEKWFKNRLTTNALEDFYTQGYTLFFKKKWIVYLISLAGIICAILLFQILPYQQLPNLDKGETVLTIDWNKPITLQENQARIADIFEDIPDIQTRFSQIGEQQYLLQRENSKSFSEAKIYIDAFAKANIEHVQNNVQEKMQTNFPEARFSFTSPETIFEYTFGTNNQELVGHVYSRNSLEVPPTTSLNEIASLFNQSSLSEVPIQKTVAISVIHDNLLLYSVQYDDLINELKTALGQNFVDDLKTSQKFIPINLGYNQETFDSTFNGLYVRSTEDEIIPVRNLVNVKNVQNYKAIKGDRSGEFLEFDLTANDDIGGVIQQIRNRFQQSNYDIRFSGSWFTVRELGKELGVVIAIAILLLYFIMAAQFESFWQPLIILLEIPIDIGGALLLLWIFGGSINLMAAIGIVVMSGIIINDSILKLHTINLLRKEGYAVDDAIKEGGRLRLKPIVMTSLTTILALVPFLFIGGLGGVLQRPLALTVIGGMLIGTFISLYFIPLLYSFFVKRFE